MKKQEGIITLTNSPVQEIEPEKEVAFDAVHVKLPNNSNTQANVARNVAPFGHSGTRKENSQKIDIRALRVSYKIKRVKQQLLVLEKLAGRKQIAISNGASVINSKQRLRGISLVIHLLNLLNKQLKRFQSLEEKTDDLCRRMHENSQVDNQRDSQHRKEKSQVLGNFPGETFQLNRVMVATGQKLVVMRAKITSGIGDSRDCFHEPDGFIMEQLSDVIKTLFREIQRGLEVRIARIIGDLEGTLACDGIRHILSLESEMRVFFLKFFVFWVHFSDRSNIPAICETRRNYIRNVDIS